MADARELSLPRVGLVSMVQLSVGGLLGSSVDAAMPPADLNTATGQLAVEVLSTGAMVGVLVAAGDRYLLDAVDPDGQAGGGMYFLGLVSSMPEFAKKVKMLSGRARVAVLDWVYSNKTASATDADPALGRPDHTQ